MLNSTTPVLPSPVRAQTSPLANPKTSGAPENQKLAQQGNQQSTEILAQNQRLKTPPATQNPKSTFTPTTTEVIANADIDFTQGNAVDLAFKAAIEGINDALSPYLGENALEAGYEAGIDVSPEATADRIVSLSTGLFSAYMEQNPDMAEDQARDTFADIISGGIENGFSEARNILDGLGVLTGNIAENIDKTYTLVMEGIDNFRQGVVTQTPSESDANTGIANSPTENEALPSGTATNTYDEVKQSTNTQSSLFNAKA